MILRAVSCLALVLAVGCDENGDTWLPHNGGVVCLGSDAAAVPGSDVYVAKSGSDENDGQSADTAFATLAKGFCNAEPGQTVHVGLGTYYESVILSVFGDKDNPITISGEVGTDGELPVVDGEDELTYGLAVVGEDESEKSGGFIVESMEFKNYTDAGLIYAIAENMVVRDCVVRDTGFDGINPDNQGEGFGLDLVEVEGLLVDGVKTYDIGPSQSHWEDGFLGNGISVYGSVDIEVRNCETSGGNGGGMLVEDSVNALVEDNIFGGAELDASGEYWDGALWVDGGHDVTVRNNIINNNHGPGLQISDEGVQQPYGYVFENNTITDNLWGVYIWNFGVCDWPDPSIVTMTNNTFSGNTNGDVMCEEWGCGEGLPCD